MYIQVNVMKDMSEEMKRDLRIAEMKTVNRMVKEAKSFAIKELSQERGFQESQLDKTIKVQEATETGLYSMLSSTSRRIPIFKLTARQTSRGIIFSLGQPKEILHAFLAQMKSGHKSVFMRYGNKRRASSGRYIGKLRQPIKELYTLSIAEFFGTKIMAQKIDSFIKNRLPNIFAEEMNR